MDIQFKLDIQKTSYHGKDTSFDWYSKSIKDASWSDWWEFKDDTLQEETVLCNWFRWELSKKKIWWTLY